jgi:hypothetical protein
MEVLLGGLKEAVAEKVLPQRCGICGTSCVDAAV